MRVNEGIEEVGVEGDRREGKEAELCCNRPSGRDNDEDERIGHSRKEVFLFLPCDCPFPFRHILPYRSILDGGQENGNRKSHERSP